MSIEYNLQFAGMNFHINSVYDVLPRISGKFRTKERGDHLIVTTQEDIDAERAYCCSNAHGIDESLLEAPDHHIETITILRKIADYVVDHNRILMHGSAISIDGKGYIFTAVSGTGKSTHTKLLRSLFGERAVMVNDDKPFLHIEDGKAFVCGSPWMGKHRLGENIVVPLCGIYFLRRSEENVLRQIKGDEALPMMLAQCHRPVQPDNMMKTLELLDNLLMSVPLYDFGCNMDISAAELSSSVMK